jgi:hypothetical protein
MYSITLVINVQLESHFNETPFQSQSILDAPLGFLNGIESNFFCQFPSSHLSWTPSFANITINNIIIDINTDGFHS